MKKILERFRLHFLVAARIINWILVIAFIIPGLVLISTLPNTGWVLITTGLLISPLIQKLVYHFIKIKLSYDFKVIIILAGLSASLLVPRYYETEEQYALLRYLIVTASLDFDNEEDLKEIGRYLEQQESGKRKQEFFAEREEHVAQLHTLMNNGHYQLVVRIGSHYAQWDDEVDRIVNQARRFYRQQQVELARQQLPEWQKTKNSHEIYRLLMPLEDEPEFRPVLNEAQKYLDKEFYRLLQAYETGHYREAREEGEPYTDSDCRVRKLVGDAKMAQAKLEAIKRLEEAVKITQNYLKNKQYRQAYRYASQFQDTNLQELAKQAQHLEKKAKEEKFLAKLRNLSSTDFEMYIRVYTELLKLFPQHEFYKEKLNYYKNQLINLRRQPPLLITHREYGTQWPFTVPKGILECSPPGIITFRTDDKTYAVNDLASSRGYPRIDDIWRDDAEKKAAPANSEEHFLAKVDLSPIINKGLELCRPL
jgi:hypothetical protein